MRDIATPAAARQEANCCMLSYLHEFHAGNNADALKHVALLSLLSRLKANDKPLRYIETHAGAGGYELRSAAALKNREFEGGIGRVWNAAEAPPAIARWLEFVRRYNGGAAKLSRYPGSPWLALEVLGERDSVFLFELHPAEHRMLERRLGIDRRAHILRQDGLEVCIGLVPPPERRGVVFVDPSYEVADEPAKVLDALVKLHRRFATGVYAVWYPVIERRWVQRFERAVRDTGIAPIDQYELHVERDGRGPGLTGSGMLVVNPPWKLREEMQVALPWLSRRLGIDDRGSHRIVHLAGE
jgi:23S rRNA (adenine2030-N6)-methyltransferase